MREDMAKVIVERPRTKSWCRWQPRNTWKQISWDEQLLQIGKLRQWRNRKQLNENLRPLFRFLESKLGQPWDRIYSEIRERINMDSTVQFHIWQHVQGYVCPHPPEHFSKWKVLGAAFLVEPETGVLVRNPSYYRWRGRKRRIAPTVLTTEFHDNQFRQIEGVWKRVQLKPLPTKEWEGQWDAFFKNFCGRIGLSMLEKVFGAGRYAVAVLPVAPNELRWIKQRAKCGEKTF